MFNNERSTILSTARAIVAKAQADHRDLTDAEQGDVEAAIAKVNQLDQQGKSGDLVRRVMAMAGPPNDPERASGLFTEDAKAGIIHAAKTRTTYRTTVDAKAALTSGSLVPTSGTGVEPGLYPTGAFPLSSLFVQQPADGPVIRYYRMTAGTAAVVAEGAAKPDAGVAITAVDLTLEKLACVAQFSDEMAEDAPYLVTYLQAELQASVATSENARILNTFNTTSGVLTGAGATTAVVDVIADAIAAAEAFSGKTPTAVVAHPTVVSAIRKSKASTAGSYMVDPTAPGPSTIHGVPLVSTAATAAATAWVVEASGVTIFRRGPLTVEIGTNTDDWVKNLRTMRAEERVGAAVTRPSSLTKLTLS